MATEKYKYKTKLHALIAKGPVPSRRAWQDAILTYLTQNCVVSNDFDKNKKEKKTFFASPLPVNVAPKQSLTDELRTEENGFIPLVLAAQVNCTSDVIAALCHLFPQGATVPCKDGSLSLHLAARRPTANGNRKKPDPNINPSDNLKAIGVLAETYPMALVTRDDKGRTPLHCLLENHVSTRHVELVERLGRTVDEKVWIYEVEAQSDEDTEKVPLPVPTAIRKKMPKQEQKGANLFTPASALAIPDKIYGGTPLHYAVKNGAAKEVIASLVKGYPASVGSVDCLNRTPLHWCFGAAGGSIAAYGYASEPTPMHHFHRSSSIISMLLKRDPAGSFDVATMRDRHPSGKPHRTPLHYAIELLGKNILDPAQTKPEEKGPASCLTIKSLQTMIDASKKALVTKDALGQTPLHVLFRGVFEKHSLEYTRALHIAQTGAANLAQPVEPRPFAPPTVLIELLLQGVEENDFDDDETIPSSLCASSIIDRRGLLALHCAVLVASSPKVLKILIENNPRSLTQLSKASVSDDTTFISKYYDFLADDPLFVSCFEASRTPIHMAFSSPFVSRVHTEEMIQTLLHFESDVKTPEKQDDDSVGSLSDVESTTGPRKKAIKIDGTIALKMQDACGDTPLHLAAKNHVSLEMLKTLMEQDAEVAMFPNNNGDLPLHYLLDKNFLFVNADLATVHGAKDNKKGAFESQDTPEFRERVRDLAKKQTIVTRLTKYKLCGAIFAPTNGWTSEDDEESSHPSYETMKKINLLGMGVIDHEQSLLCRGSDHGLNCIQILIAFHAAPYKVIRSILRRNPLCVQSRSTASGYTALGLHCIRRSIPNEVRKDELDCWKAVKELLFVYELFPLESNANFTEGAVYSCRKDKDMIHSLEQQILAEVSGDCLLSYHWDGNHPIDPIHMKLGFFENLEIVPFTKESDNHLSEVCTRAWMFIAAFVNISDPSDQYAASVDRIFEKLNYDETRFLLRLQVFPGTFRNIQTVNWDNSTLTIDHYANIFCKVIFHKYKYFAGMYDFDPSGPSSILVHRGRNSDSAILAAKQKKFILKKPNDGLSNGNWMYDPRSDVRKRNDFEIEEEPVVFKFMTNHFDYEREVKWRKEFVKGDEIDGIIPILTTFDPNCIDGEEDKKYAIDRIGQRFKKLPLHANAKEENPEDTMDLTMYPYAVVFPFAAGGTLHDLIRHGTTGNLSPKNAGLQVAILLKEMHARGLIHGSLTARNILSFLDNRTKEIDLKVTGLPSLTPADQTAIKLGAITPGGKCKFDHGCLPPEMFMKVDPLELSQYNQYWDSVLELDKVKIPADLIRPRIDPITNDTYVLKCYCNLEDALAELLPPLPYELVELDESLDIWSFGIFLFNLISGGETIFQPNLRTGKITSIEMLANWNTDMAESMVSQYVKDVAAQDLLLHILVSGDQRKLINMSTILAHPFFSTTPVPDDIVRLMEDAMQERDLIRRVRKKQKESRDAAKETSQVTHLGRLSLRTQLRLTNSATEALKEAFDSAGHFTKDAPFTYMLLPYKLTQNKEGRLIPGTKMDMELAQRVGRQMLDLCKVVGFAACYNETLATRSERFHQSVSSLFLSADIDTFRAAQDLLTTFHLDNEHYSDIATRFVNFVKEDIKKDRKKFVEDPLAPVIRIVSHYASSIAETFTVTNRAFLYLVDEFASAVPLDSIKGEKYPHLFRDHLKDIVYKSLPYMHACVSSAICAESGPEGLVKLISEGAYPDMPESWIDAFRGIPVMPIRRRMVAEIQILHQVSHFLITPESPIALNGEAEMQFLSSLFLHIDSARTFGGLCQVTDESGVMWVSEESKRQLLEESAVESSPERVYENYTKLEAEFEIMQEKDQKIAQLEKALIKTTREVEELKMAEI